MSTVSINDGATVATIGAEPKPGNACKRGFLWWTRILRVIAILALLFNVACYIVLIVVGTKKEVDLATEDKVFLVLAALGLAILSLVFAAAEIEVKIFLRHMYALHFWPTRGFGIAWLGAALMRDTAVLAAALSVANGKSYDESLNDFMKVFGKAVAWIEISVGGIYVLMSLLCLRKLLDDGTAASEAEVFLPGDGEGLAKGKLGAQDVAPGGVVPPPGTSASTTSTVASNNVPPPVVSNVSIANKSQPASGGYVPPTVAGTTPLSAPASEPATHADPFAVGDQRTNRRSQSDTT